MAVLHSRSAADSNNKHAKGNSRPYTWYLAPTCRHAKWKKSATRAQGHGTPNARAQDTYDALGALLNTQGGRPRLVYVLCWHVLLHWRALLCECDYRRPRGFQFHETDFSV